MENALGKGPEKGIALLVMRLKTKIFCFRFLIKVGLFGLVDSLGCLAIARVTLDGLVKESLKVILMLSSSWVMHFLREKKNENMKAYSMKRSFQISFLTCS